MKPNNADLSALTSRWTGFTAGIDDGAKHLQDHAYALGYERARLDAKQVHDELVAALRNLLAGLDSTNWSSWQTTAHFSAQQEAASAVLAKVGG